MQRFKKTHHAPAPSFLYRHFTEKTHAQEFINGNLRLGLYKSYSTLPENDIRANLQEGSLKICITYPDGKVSHAVLGGAYALYIVCCLKDDANIKIKMEHGKYAVKINSPELFHQRLSNHIGKALRAKYQGHMVYGLSDIKLESSEISNFLELTVYTDLAVNASKNEYRFSYLIDFVLAKKSPDLFFSDTFLWNKQPIPRYLHLNGVAIQDLCTLVEY